MKKLLLITVPVVIVLLIIFFIVIFMGTKNTNLGIFKCSSCVSGSGMVSESPSGRFNARIEIKGTNISNNYALLFIEDSNVSVDESRDDSVAFFDILESQVGMSWSDVNDIMWVIEKTGKSTDIRPFVLSTETGKWEEVELSFFDQLSVKNCIPSGLHPMLKESDKKCF